ncbi:MAG: amylo-alpha-1,6-glucosidase [Methanolobus sp.]|nr:amylo-alpha-1,6-glucosidase [Methanolobus sp.]
MDHSEYSKATANEWIVANGLGGYASSTVIGANTRKYHGLLIASLKPPVERRLLLSSLDEELITQKETFRLAVHKYPDAIYPRGNDLLVDFYREPFPTFMFNAGGMKIKKQIMMLHGLNSTVIRYHISNPSGTKGLFRILPLVNNRSVHRMTRSDDFTFMQEVMPGKISLEWEDSSFSLYSDMRYQADEHWYYNFEYDAELLRGYPHREDNFNPGHFDLEISGKDASCFIVASTENDEEWNWKRIQELFDNEKRRLKGLAGKNTTDDPFLKKLVLAGDLFIVERRSTGSKSVIAGYHWFGDWGRDTMISLPGLTLVTGRYDDARSILSTFAAHCKEGLIPNLFPEQDSGSPAYNTVDASLWFVHAAGRYMDYTNDTDFIKMIWPTIENILENYRKGTAYDIRMDEDGLIEHAGQLTWMDAKIGDLEVTPRKGKACEINALWFNALMYAGKIGKRIGTDVSGFTNDAKLVKRSFREQFWNNEKKCLYDCIQGSWKERDHEKDDSVRPNQILAVSLPHTMLSADMEKNIVDVVTEELLTPYGLRTLSPFDKRYKGIYAGNPERRDSAYHNGTVWPWLLGPYITAFRKVYGDKPDLKGKLRSFLQMIEKHMDEACIGTISEVFDGDIPHYPGGCVSQAWSVAEIMRCYLEDILAE